MARAKRWNEVFITIEDFNKELARVKATRQIVFENCANIYLKTQNWRGFKCNAYVWDTGRGTIHLAYRMGGKSFNFVTSVDGQDKERAEKEVVSGGRAWCVANRYNHIEPNCPNLGKKLPSVSGLLYHNPNYERQWIKAWHYDMNSAYAHILMHYQFPDLENPLEPGIVEEGQIGFNVDFTRLIRSGLAVNRYNLIDSPYKTCAEKEFAQVQKLRLLDGIAKHSEILSCLLIQTALLLLNRLMSGLMSAPIAGSLRLNMQESILSIPETILTGKVRNLKSEAYQKVC